MTKRRILEGIREKNLQATLLFVDFFKTLGSIHRGKMEQILLAYGLPKETVAAVMMLYKNTKVKVRFPDGDRDYFDSVAGVLQGDALTPYQFIICLDYLLRTSIDLMKEKCFKLAKERSRRYPSQAITGADYADDIAPSANTPTKAESQLQSLERTPGGVGLPVNSDKTEYMGFNRRSDISTRKGGSQKLVEKFTYLENIVLSIENDINTWLAKAWTAIDWLTVIWKSDRADKIKCCFFPSSGRINTAIWMYHMDANKTYGEKAWWQLHKNAVSCIDKIQEEAPHKTAAIRSPTTHHKNYPS